MSITVAQSRLILNTFMAEVRSNLVASDLVTWKLHTDEMNDRNGFVVSEQRGPGYNITETDSGVADLSGGVQSTVFGSETFTLNKTFGLSMGASDLERVTDIQSARSSQMLQNGIADLTQAIDYHIMDVAAKAFPHSVGTWGLDVDNPDEVGAARQRLAEAGIESDRDISAVHPHADRRYLSKYLYNDNASLASEGSRAMRQGFNGMLSGIPTRFTNNLGRITTGTRTNGTVDGASQNVDYSAVSDAGSNAGYYMSQTFDVAGLGAGGTVKAGEVFSVTTGTSVYAFDPKIGHNRPYEQQFTVLEDATADGTGAATLRIFPAMIVGDGTSTTGTAGVNNAHRSVSNAPDNGATVTFLGTASTEYTPRLMFDKRCIAVHTAPLIRPYSGFSERRSLSAAQGDIAQGGPRPPLMPRLWIDSTHATGVHNARIDVFVQAQAADKFRGIKFFGTA